MRISQLTSRRPYLLRACYEWLLDNNLTPYLVVDINLPRVMVPIEYANNGQIILNITPRAVGNLKLGNEEVRFNARFNGVLHQVFVPMMAVLAIYARENGVGTMFEPEPNSDEDTEFNASVAKADHHEQSVKTVMVAIDDNDDYIDNVVFCAQDDYHNSPDDDPSSRCGRPSLRIVK